MFAAIPWGDVVTGVAALFALASVVKLRGPAPPRASWTKK